MVAHYHMIADRRIVLGIVDYHVVAITTADPVITGTNLLKQLEPWMGPTRQAISDPILEAVMIERGPKFREGYYSPQVFHWLANYTYSKFTAAGILPTWRKSQS